MPKDPLGVIAARFDTNLRASVFATFAGIIALVGFGVAAFGKTIDEMLLSGTRIFLWVGLVVGFSAL
jgi:hypothetical protein